MARAFAAALAFALGSTLVALEVEDRWHQNDWDEVESPSSSVQHAAEGSSFAQTGLKMGPKIHAGLLSESPVRRGSSRWLRGALGSLMAVCLAVAYAGLPGLSGDAALQPFQGPHVAAKAPEGDLGVRALEPQALQLLAECSDGKAEAAALPLPPPGLGFERGFTTPWLAKLGSLPEEAHAEDEQITRPSRGAVVPGRGDLQGLFRESKKAFQEAAEELDAEERRRAYGDLFRDTRRAFEEAHVDLTLEEWRQGLPTEHPLGPGTWQ